MKNKLEKYGWKLSKYSEKVIYAKATEIDSLGEYVRYDKTLRNKIYINAEIQDVEELQTICDTLREVAYERDKV